MSDIKEGSACLITPVLELIGGKWKPIILHFLGTGKRRYGEIAVRIPTISRKVLTEQLKELEKDNLIVRRAYKEIPPRVEYEITDLGKSLTPVFTEMVSWTLNNILAKRKSP